MLLKDWMRAEGVSDAEMAEKIGAISHITVRKLRFRQRGPSIRVAARIHEITGGRVTTPEMEPPPKIAPRQRVDLREGALA